MTSPAAGQGVGDRKPLVVGGLVAATAAAVSPWAPHDLGPHVGFLPAVIAMVACLDLLSVYVLLAQFRSEGDPRTLMMGGAYLWSLVIMLGYASAFPGIVAPQPPFATAASVAPWLYVIWHTSFPVLLTVAWAPWPARFLARVDQRRRGSLARSVTVCWLGASAALVAFLVLDGPGLPVLIKGVDTSRMTSLTAPICLPLVLFSVLVTGWALRRSTGPERWTITATWVCLMDLALTYFSAHRYSIGWYAGRLLTVVAAAVVLIAMLQETSRLKAALADSLDRLGDVEELQRTILDNLGVGVVLTNPTGRVLMANDAARAMFPTVTAGELFDRGPMWTLAGAPIPDAQRPVGRTARTGRPERDLVVRVTAPGGEPLWLSVNTTAVPGPDGGPRAVLSSSSDVTDRELALAALEASARELVRARDDALAATAAKSAFLAAMSHEIRTPMNAVIGMTGLLLDTRLDAGQREFAETVRSSGETLLAVINDVLDFSKIESGELELDEHPFDLRECVESAMSILALAAGGKGLELVVEFEPDCPELLVGDMSRIRQVIINLLANAVKFTAAGEVIVRLSARPLPEHGPDAVELRIAVRDTGIGISPDRMHRLFQPFLQTDASTSRVYGGTGLGLVISRRLAQAMAGDLQVSSEVGAGSTFVLTARLRVAPDRRASSAAASVTAASPAGRSVLVVDDNAANSTVLRQLLSGWGMACTLVADPADAVRLCTAGSSPVPVFDVVILDMQMPGMDGVQLAAALRELPGFGHLPMILCSSPQGRPGGEPGNLFSCVLTKPVRSAVLRDQLLSVLAPVDAALDAVETGGGRRRSDAPAPPIMLRILLAEDDPVNQKVAELMLAKLGHQVVTVGTGLAAVRSLQAGYDGAQDLAAFDAVLMDMQMPELDGVAATRLIRAGLPATEQPFIIALTASALAEDRAACLDAGMDAFLVKPFRLAELDAALRRCRSHREELGMALAVHDR